jgi:hypothetical protein
MTSTGRPSSTLRTLAQEFESVLCAATLEPTPARKSNAIRNHNLFLLSIIPRFAVELILQC